jgi:hypothetical protein
MAGWRAAVKRETGMGCIPHKRAFTSVGPLNRASYWKRRVLQSVSPSGLVDAMKWGLTGKRSCWICYKEITHNMVVAT